MFYNVSNRIGFHLITKETKEFELEWKAIHSGIIIIDVRIAWGYMNNKFIADPMIIVGSFLFDKHDPLMS